MLLRDKFRHSLFHLLLTVVAQGICLIWISNAHNWSKVGSIWYCVVLHIIFLVELCKVLMARYYGNYVKNVTELRQLPLNFDIDITRVFSRLVVHLFAVLVYTCGCIALGASQIDYFQQTLIISLVLTFQTVTPIVMLFDGIGLMHVVFCEPFSRPVTEAELTALDLIKYNAVGGVLGAWIGSAVGMSYNWMYAYLSYPIPNVFGILAGSLLANTFGLARLLYDILDLHT